MAWKWPFMIIGKITMSTSCKLCAASPIIAKVISDASSCFDINNASGHGIFRSGGTRRTGLVLASLNRGTGDETSQRIFRIGFASISSPTDNSTTTTTTTSGTPQITIPQTSSSLGSPLFWIGVGVGLTVLFTTVSSKLKRYAMQQVVKTMIGQTATSNGGLSNAPGFPGTQFPFPPIAPSAPRATSSTLSCFTIATYRGDEEPNYFLRDATESIHRQQRDML
ncbi:protein TIC 40, chloroplastic-like [Dioscorea cayenensis subsp. rotundata]|uniref:Protein TIC 40, chloroplastic-like n=1 Tax=Dioscorea cayennensis subsp. rotundata TaxID=55577 RepID=A0AB40B809_DIOCR|nr:protein TIC 40, chloroplastic-like [Dioscorea cayenensis subsp. rotundata]